MLSLLIAAVLAGFTFQQGTGPEGPPAQTASIRGRVVDKVTGAPLARAVVIVRRMRMMNEATQALTDADGRFELTGLVPDAYDLAATAGEFRASHARHGPGADKPIPLRPGEVREVSIALAPALAISGRVVDQAGLPVSGSRIEVQDFSSGFNSYGSHRRETDDLGAFRMFGLPPGRYRVCAGVNTSPKFGSATGKRLVRFVRTCYPSAPDEAEAAPIVVTDSDVAGIEIQMQRRPTFTIRGVVLDSTGNAVEPSRVGLMHIEGDSASGSSQRISGSRFTISNIVPGRYVVSAEIGPEPSPNSQPIEKGLVPLDVISEDVENLVLTMKKLVGVRGAVAYEDGPPPDLQVERLSVEAMPVDIEAGGVRDFPARVGTDFTFELKNLFGPYVLSLSGLPPTLIVRSILYRGRDVLQVPTEFDGDPRNVVEILVTSRVAHVSGRVFDDRGNASAGARIYFFPADPAKWKGWMGGPSTSGKDGSFRLLRLAAGDYLAAAISAEDAMSIARMGSRGRSHLDRLAKIAERITLLDNDRRVVDLIVRSLPAESKER
jgi:protocatechuate 3,4-dioxygenase beta subunit